MSRKSQLARLLMVGAIGAAVMIGCSSDEGSTFPVDQSAVSTVDPETSSTIASDKPTSTSTTTVAEATTTTTTEVVEATSTTVKRTGSKSGSATTAAPVTTFAPASVPEETTAAPVTTPATTPPTTTAPSTTTTLPPVNVTAQWSGENSGCPSAYPGSLTLEVVVTGGSAPQVSVSVHGTPVTRDAPPYSDNATETFWFNGFPTTLEIGSYTVNISVSDVGHSTTNLTETVVYNCP